MIKDWFVKNRLHVIYICIVVAMVIGFAFLYHSLQAIPTPPPVAKIENTTPTGVASGQAAAGKYTGAEDAADVSDLIKKAQTKPATATFVTTTQAAADKQAQAMAVADHADYLLKETAGPKSGEVAAENSATKSGQVENNYYAITQERKHRVAAGITVFKGEPYVSALYTNGRLTLGIHSRDLQQIDGATVAYTIKKW